MNSTEADTQLDGKSRILVEARTLFLERGFAVTSMQDIADASGLTKAALYYHFRDKDQLFSTMAFLEMDRIGLGLEALLNADLAFRERLINAGTYLLKSMEGDLSRMMVEVFEHLCTGDQSEFSSKRARFIDEGVVPVFVEAARKGDIRNDLDSRFVAALWLSMIFGQFNIRRMGEVPPMPIGDLAVAIANVLLDGVAGIESQTLAS